MKLALLHPGAMGVTVGQALLASGHDVGWVAAGRSDATKRRAQGLTEHQHLHDLLGQADAVISVCPPHAALAQAQQVKQTGFSGIYVDANAVAPATAAEIARMVGAGSVDGGIIGPPALSAGTTRLYLSGERAAEVASWFSAGHLQARVIGGDNPVAASALKMAYAAQTKGASALLLAVNALASRLGVEEALREEWALSQPALAARSEAVAAGTAGKAWRFAGEMREIAATFTAAGLPDDFHLGAAQIYEAMADLRDQSGISLQQAVACIVAGDEPE